MTEYRRRKEVARERARVWQYETFTDPAALVTYGELTEMQAYFETLARRFGLVHEFRENGII